MEIRLRFKARFEPPIRGQRPFEEMPQRPVVTEDHSAALAPRTLGEKRQKAHCPQTIAVALLAVHNERLARQRLALPVRADRGELLLRVVQLAGKRVARLVMRPAFGETSIADF